MNGWRERWALRVVSGENRGPLSVVLRLGLLLIEPFYALLMIVRNGLYRAGVFKSHRLPRPTVAVGNLTTGGTGKTPIVRWLAEQLAGQGLRCAILLRGYRSETTGGASDEQQMLAGFLGSRAIVVANPDRGAGAAAAMGATPPPGVFILDDAFQHQRVARDFNLLLISASHPFGYGHVLPRGLLREPVRGLKRADAVLITRCNVCESVDLEKIKARVRRYRTDMPIFHANHLLTGLRTRDDQSIPLEELGQRRFLLFTGIADPRSLQDQLEKFGDTFAGTRTFPDHHAFSDDDLVDLRRAASEVGAHALLTTEKDWVKVSPLATARDGPPILRLELEIGFRDDDENRLLDLVLDRISATTPAGLSAQAPG
jgi:tetraacyldisaccharide 4'-kinase